MRWTPAGANAGHTSLYVILASSSVGFLMSECSASRNGPICSN
jgi:hypothetical protein